MNFYEHFVEWATSLSGKSVSINTESFPLWKETCAAEELEQCRKYIKDSDSSQQEKEAFSLVLDQYAAASKTIEFLWNQEEIKSRFAGEYPLNAKEIAERIGDSESKVFSVFTEGGAEYLKRGGVITDPSQYNHLWNLYIELLPEKFKEYAKKNTKNVISFRNILMSKFGRPQAADHAVVRVFFKGLEEWCKDPTHILTVPSQLEALWESYVKKLPDGIQISEGPASDELEEFYIGLLSKNTHIEEFDRLLSKEEPHEEFSVENSIQKCLIAELKAFQESGFNSALRMIRVLESNLSMYNKLKCVAAIGALDSSGDLNQNFRNALKEFSKLTIVTDMTSDIVATFKRFIEQYPLQWGESELKDVDSVEAVPSNHGIEQANLGNQAEALTKESVKYDFSDALFSLNAESYEESYFEQVYPDGRRKFLKDFVALNKKLLSTFQQPVPVARLCDLWDDFIKDKRCPEWLKKHNTAERIREDILRSDDAWLSRLLANASETEELPTTSSQHSRATSPSVPGARDRVIRSESRKNDTAVSEAEGKADEKSPEDKFIVAYLVGEIESFEKLPKKEAMKIACQYLGPKFPIDRMLAELVRVIPEDGGSLQADARQFLSDLKEFSSKISASPREPWFKFIEFLGKRNGASLQQIKVFYKDIKDDPSMKDKLKELFFEKVKAVCEKSNIDYLVIVDPEEDLLAALKTYESQDSKAGDSGADGEELCTDDQLKRLSAKFKEYKSVNASMFYSSSPEDSYLRGLAPIIRMIDQVTAPRGKVIDPAGGKEVTTRFWKANILSQLKELAAVKAGDQHKYMRSSLGAYFRATETQNMYNKMHAFFSRESGSMEGLLDSIGAPKEIPVLNDAVVSHVSAAENVSMR